MNHEELKHFMRGRQPAMSSAERMAGYIAGKEVDFQPFALLSADFAFANIFGYTAKQYLENFAVKIDVLKRKKNEFDQDSLDIALGLKGMGAALGSKRAQPENGIDYVTDYALKDYSDFDKLAIPDPYANPVLGKILSESKNVKKALPDYIFTASVAGPITTAISVRPLADVLKDTRKNQENLHRLLDLTTDSNLTWLKALKAEFGPISVTFADPVACSDILSEKQFDEFSMPHFKRMIEGIKEIMGKYPGGHICGSSRKLWLKLAEAGVALFSIDNCEDLADAKKTFGDKMMLMGNVPPVDIIKDGTADDVIEACKECIKKGADSPRGFVLASGCQVPIGTPRENVEAFIYAARKYGGGAQIGRFPKGLSS